MGEYDRGDDRDRDAYYKNHWTGLGSHWNDAGRQGYDKSKDVVTEDMMSLKDPKRLKKDPKYRSADYDSDEDREIERNRDRRGGGRSNWGGRHERSRSRSRPKKKGGGQKVFARYRSISGGWEHLSKSPPLTRIRPVEPKRGGGFSVGNVVLSGATRKRSDAASSEILGRPSGKKDDWQGGGDGWDNGSWSKQRQEVTLEDYFMVSETVRRGGGAMHEVVSVDPNYVLNLRPKKRANWFEQAMKLIKSSPDEESNVYSIVQKNTFWESMDSERCEKIRSVFNKNSMLFSNRHRETVNDLLEIAEKAARRRAKAKEEDKPKPNTKGSPQTEEYRIDPADGNAYSLQEFLEQYNGIEEWEKAEPAGNFKKQAEESQPSAMGFGGFKITAAPKKVLYDI